MKIFIVSFLVLIVLAGCQAQKDPSAPYSNGPTTPPRVEGPNSAPPASSQQPAAISEEEPGQFTLQTIQ